MCKLSPVIFHGDTIFCITIENQPYTPAKPIVENMGLAWQAQSAKLSANKERWGIMMIVIPSESGEQETTCIPVRKLPAFLASINPKKVKPELRERIELYQAECDDALWNYWMNGRAERTAGPALPPTDAPITPDQQCTLQAMVKALVERGGIYANIWSRFNNHFRIARYCQLPQSRMSEAVDYLMRFEVAPKALPAPSVAALPEAERPPLYRDGMFHLPPVNPAYVPGPREAALRKLLNNWWKREEDVKAAFDAMLHELAECRGNLFTHAMSDMGRNAETLFSPDSMTEGFLCPYHAAETAFRQALRLARIHLKMALNTAAMLHR